MKSTNAIMSALLAAAILDTEKETKDTEIDKDKLRRDSEDIGNVFYHILLGYKDAGFTEEQAFTLLLETIRRN